MYLHAYVLGEPLYSFTPMLLNVLEYTHVPLCMSTPLYKIICFYALICTHVLECTYLRIHTYTLVYVCSYFDVCVRLCTCIPACSNAYTRLNFCTYLRNTHVRTDVYTYKSYVYKLHMITYLGSEGTVQQFSSNWGWPAQNI